VGLGENESGGTVEPIYQLIYKLRKGDILDIEQEERSFHTHPARVHHRLAHWRVWELEH
jgi:hypothetical protein